MQLQLYPYRRRKFGNGMVRANAAVINAAILGNFCCTHNTYEDQTPYLETGTVNLP
jgi:hypothetical protein